MQRRTFLGTMIASLVWQRGWAIPAELPACPADFEWVRSPLLEAFVPAPRGWRYEEEFRNGSATARFQRMDLAAGTLPTKFCVCKIPELEGDIVTWTRAFTQMCREGTETIQPFEIETEDLISCGIEQIPPRASLPTEYRIRVVGVGNKRTNMCYLVQFESQADRWDEEWKLGQQIYEMFAINPKV